MAGITLKGLKKSYGTAHVIKGVDIDIEDGEFVVFVGPSGCGKSTLLRMIAGLEDISAGELSIGGKVVNDLPPKDRGVAMVFQSYAIFPHMSVRENVGVGLTIAGASKAEKAEKVAEAARILNSKAEAAARPKTEVRVDYEIGDQVKVLEGPFASFNGLVEELDFDKGRVKVSVSIFGRPTPVELEFEQVERMK